MAFFDEDDTVKEGEVAEENLGEVLDSDESEELDDPLVAGDEKWE